MLNGILENLREGDERQFLRYFRHFDFFRLRGYSPPLWTMARPRRQNVLNATARPSDVIYKNKQANRDFETFFFFSFFLSRLRDSFLKTNYKTHIASHDWIRQTFLRYTSFLKDLGIWGRSVNGTSIVIQFTHRFKNEQRENKTKKIRKFNSSCSNFFIVDFMHRLNSSSKN